MKINISMPIDLDLKLEVQLYGIERKMLADFTKEGIYCPDRSGWR